MNDVLKWKVPKIPFWVANFLLMGFAYYFILHAPHAVSPRLITAVCLGCVTLGAVLAIIPYYLDYAAIGKLIEINALGSVAERIQSLEQFTAKIEAVTDQWTVVQESVHQNAEKTGVAAKQVAEKMSDHLREYSESMELMNDSEKNTLRLEVDKLRRSEIEYIQMLVRMLDHIFALRAAAVRSGQQNVADQITQFQSACLGMVRRIGLISIAGEPEEPFNAARHQVADGKKPSDGAIISETVAAGYTFQGKLLRPALVRLREPKPASPTTTPPATANPIPAATTKPASPAATPPATAKPADSKPAPTANTPTAPAKPADSKPTPPATTKPTPPAASSKPAEKTFVLDDGQDNLALKPE